MSMFDTIVQEMTQEMVGTRKCLERIPVKHLDWTPHVKSFTFRRLASHIVEIPTWTMPILDSDEMVLDMDSYVPYEAGSVAELLERFDRNMQDATAAMQGREDELLSGMWRMKVKDQVVFEAPRIAVLRGMVLNHAYHHRGQLTVYLRMKDAPLPALYGPSADEGQMV